MKNYTIKTSFVSPDPVLIQRIVIGFEAILESIMQMLTTNIKSHQVLEQLCDLKIVYFILKEEKMI